MTVRERIKHIRHNLKISQAKFSKAIAISDGYIASIELGNRKVNERIIRLICSTFAVSEQWLKYGEGDMFVHASDDKLEKMLGYFKQLNPVFQDYVLQQIYQLVELQEKVYARKTQELSEDK